MSIGFDHLLVRTHNWRPWRDYARPPKTLGVFVVDDEHAIAMSLAMILQAHGFNATPFTEPLLALQAAQSSAPDLLLSDVMMPGLSGIELAIHIQIDSPDSKVLLCSGSVDAADLLATARAVGRDYEFLPKPVHPVDLLHRVHLLVEDGSDRPPDPLAA